ncbi:accessory factor UbiK family protein [Roseomonas sp. CECT 9278]|uniref:accessory factor UbiK family protein n=1 Tax=Roseomonas sp. CECT 9278 TaxID=2845823 RepID=UPI001E53F129|nr:accessory factor UbiK family protein [Roseomonas sp. CECT 9278]CAH0293637.1 Ubiquinone biosynthesis accessory factor UbiK [Roseomonas sp. CECT 9278]
MAGDSGRGKFMDDLAGMAGGAFSVLAGLRNEVEAMAKSQAEAVVRRLDLVKREELDAAMEVARRAREQAEALEARVAALEARLAAHGAGGGSSSES